ncbi:glycosyltransferase family 2 protein [Thioflexithrix psekupsensis]|nr:glycosyltransferase family 2 protein [Thioflexithrix psekupsensis]
MAANKSDIMLNSPFRLSIVFLNYNRLADTRYTLSHLQHLVAHRHDIEIIAIDNASSDGTASFLRTQESERVIVLEMSENTGIAGYNEGFKRARGDYILVLDDDSHPVDGETLDRFIQRFDQQADIGVIACRIEDAQQHIVRTWHLPKEDYAGKSMAFVGCGFAIRRELFAQIGWYPASFFLYQNEMWVAIEVLKAGYTIYYDPTCRVIHRASPVGRSHWRRVYYPTRNTLWLIRHYFPFPMAYYLIVSRLFLGFIRAVQAFEFGWYYRAVKEGLFTPIAAQPLPKELREQLTPFWRQNSIWHQLIGRL